jgi:hypothetical protein
VSVPLLSFNAFPLFVLWISPISPSLIK